MKFNNQFDKVHISIKRLKYFLFKNIFENKKSFLKLNYVLVVATEIHRQKIDGNLSLAEELKNLKLGFTIFAVFVFLSIFLLAVFIFCKIQKCCW